MTGGYEARALDLASAREVLLPLWLENLPTRGDLDEKLRWFYRDGPHGAGEAFVLQSSGRAVGCAGLGVRALSLHGSPARAAVFADLAIERAHRTALPALTLVRAVQHEVEREFDLGYGFPNVKAIGVYLRAGYQLLGTMRRYVRLVRTERHLRPAVPAPVVRAVAVAGDTALAVLAAVNRWRAHGYELRWPAEPGDDLDELWRETSAAHGVACVRDRALLRWRFSTAPGHGYRFATAYRSGRLRAYAVIRIDDAGIAQLADLHGAGTGELDALLGLLVPALAERGAAAVSFDFLGDPAIPAVLGRHGFVPRGEGRPIIATAGHRAIPPAATWYLTDLDEDT